MISIQENLVVVSRVLFLLTELVVSGTQSINTGFRKFEDHAKRVANKDINRMREIDTVFRE